MPTIDELTPEQLRDPEIFEKIKEFADEFILHSQAKEAFFLQQKLTSILEAADIKSLDPNLDKQYQNLIAQVKWVAMPMLSNEETLKVLKENYLAALDNEDIDALDRMEAKMFSMGLMPRDQFRQQLQRTIKENMEKLGPKTVSQWIFDYNKVFDFRERDNLSPIKYINQNSEARALPEKEKTSLIKTLRIFDDALVVTPVFSEPELSLAVRAMIKGGIIKGPISPAILQSVPAPIAPKLIAKEIISPKPGFFQKLFSQKPKIEEKLPEIKLEKPIIPPTIKPKEEKTAKEEYEGKISPYEIEREMSQIPTFPEKIEEIEFEKKEEIKKEEPKEEPKKEEPEKPKIETRYEIRTMKGDIETAKRQTLPTGRQAIPPKSVPKIHDNIVDLSGK